MFELQNTTLEYDSRVILRNINLTIQCGQRVALIGQSGVGKSTLLRHLRQLQHQQSAWCPQQPGLVPTHSVFHNIYMGALERHSNLYNFINLMKPLAVPLAEVSSICERLNLQDKITEPAESLSGGQQQRVAIGRALYQKKPIFMGDEPVSNLDRYQADKLLNIIVHEHNTLILALHDTDQAIRLCTRIIGLKNGVIALDSPSEEVTKQQLAELYS